MIPLQELLSAQKDMVEPSFGSRFFLKKERDRERELHNSLLKTISSIILSTVVPGMKTNSPRVFSMV